MLELYGTIAEESWFDDDITPAQFREELFAGSGPVTVWINSPGGDGIAASAASVIAMAGTEVLMAPTALMMIHNPATIAMGNHEDMQKAIEMLDEVKESIINAYEIKTSLSRAKLSHLMDAETWMNANKAVELGFADGILEDEKAAEIAIPAYAFSRKTVQAALMNKISAKAKPVQKADVTAEAQTDTPAQPEEPAGRSVDELKARLNTIKNFI